MQDNAMILSSKRSIDLFMVKQLDMVIFTDHEGKEMVLDLERTHRKALSHQSIFLLKHGSPLLRVSEKLVCSPLFLISSQ